MTRYQLTRSQWCTMAAGFGVLFAAAGPAAAAPNLAATLAGDPEQKDLKIGISVPDVAYLPLYVARAKGLFTKEGLNVQLVTFSGDASSTQALAGGSIDVNAASMPGFLNLFQSGQPAKVIWDLSNEAFFSFVGSAKVHSWSDLKGGTFGITSYGSMTAALATVALGQHGLTINKDVQFVQTGGSPNAYAAIQSGQLGAATFSLPYALMAKREGLPIIGTQLQVTGPAWPTEVLYAKDDFLRKNPKTVSAMLRAIVAADALIASEPGDSTKALQDTMKLEPDIAAAAYKEARGTFPTDGRFPRDLSSFWKVMIVAKTVTEPIPQNKWYDQTWVETRGHGAVTEWRCRTRSPRPKTGRAPT
jgi:NitT/TauT family transport system substrate-binding protein